MVAAGILRPYSMDPRKRVVAACDAREVTRVQVAERFGASTSRMRGLLQRRRETGSIAPLPQNAGRKPKLDDRQMQRLHRLAERCPDATLQEMKEGLKVQMSDRALLRAPGVLGLTLKKKRSKRRGRSVKT
jgi:transposase